MHDLKLLPNKASVSVFFFCIIIAQKAASNLTAFAYFIFVKLSANRQKEVQKHVSLVKQKSHAKNQLVLST